MTQFFIYENSHHGEVKLAYQKHLGADTDLPGLVFFPGFKSDMTGSKAQAVFNWAVQHHRSALLFDYFGHGQSEGNFAAGIISAWREEVNTVLQNLTTGKQILIGSSFGGFLSLLAALDQPERIAALVLIAPAVDMTERLMWQNFSEDERRQIETEGGCKRASEYDDEGYPITRALIEDGRAHCLLDKAINVHIPVRILHGQEDASVPWQLSFELAEKITGDDVRLHMFKNGDHSLSEPPQLDFLRQVLQEIK